VNIQSIQAAIRPAMQPARATSAAERRPVTFGQIDDKKPVKPDIKGSKGLWITSEFYHPTLPDKLKGGGLAQVSSTIPWQMKALGVDMRPIFPMYNAMLDQGFKKADCAPVTLPAINGEDPEICELYYKVIDGVTCYAIKSPSFSQFNDLYAAAKTDKNPILQPLNDPEADKHIPKAFHQSGGGYSGQHSGSSPMSVDAATHHSGGATHHSGGMVDGMVTGPEAKVINKYMFKFNQAVAAFAPMLNGKAKDGPAWQFKGDADINFFNDWMAGVILGELEAANKKNHYKDKTQSVFFVHNTYDPDVMSLETAKKLGISIPKEVENEFKYKVEEHVDEDDDVSLLDDPPPGKQPAIHTDGWFNNWLKGLLGQQAQSNQSEDVQKAKINKKIVEKLNEKGWGVSPLSWGLRFADMVVINERFKETNLDTDFPNDKVLRRFLGDKDRKGLVFDMHHLVSDKYNPVTAESLKTGGFKPLAANTEKLSRAERLDALKAFKQHNKLALQKEFGLKQDPKAVIFSMTNRPEFRQKGILRIMHTMEKFLTEHPHAQYVLFGFMPKDPNPIVDSFIQSIQQNPDFKGRVVFKGFMPQAVSMQLMAGSTYHLTPSTYEPYGLTQLEPMKFGTPPIVSDRDGLFSTVYDPHILPSYNPSPSDRRKTAYGQTGYMMQSPTDNIDYLRQLDKPNWKPTDKAIRQSNEAFYKVMDRAYTDAMKGKNLEVGLKSMDYVNNEHNFEKIAQLYVPVIEKALERKLAKAKKLEAQG
jgi:glycogen synthase